MMDESGKLRSQYAELREWLQANHPLLLPEVFAGKGSDDSHATAKRNVQLEQVRQLAPGADADSAMARQALCYLLATAGSSGQGEKYLQQIAAEGIAQSCRGNFLACYELFPFIRQALTQLFFLTASARQSLLLALSEVARAERAGTPAAGYEQIAATFMEALDLELERDTDEQDEQYQVELIASLKSFRHANMFAVIDAMASAHPLEKVRAAARQMLAGGRDSILPLWDATVCDQIASRDSQAKRLRTLLNENLSVEATVQAIFNNTKGNPVAGAGDPRLPYLRFALSDHNQKIQLGAALSFIQGTPGGSDWEQAVCTIADLAMNSANLGLSRDALTMLQKLELGHPEQMEIIDRAKERASATFVESFRSKAEDLPPARS